MNESDQTDLCTVAKETEEKGKFERNQLAELGTEKRTLDVFLLISGEVRKKVENFFYI